MNKKEFNMLEKVFASEIDMTIQRNLRMYQGKSKYLKILEDGGLIQKVETKLGGRFPVVIKGYVTTMEGHFYYCMNC